jgi:signal recognition particle subunit SRP54
MFDTLSSKLQNAFKNLRGLGRISESNISDSLREVRLALLDADVNFKVVRDFIERVKNKSLGQEVLQSIQPGQQIIKIIHDELVALLGAENAGLNLTHSPSCLMLVGLHGSGKTTSTGKLGRWLQKQGRAPLLVAADVYRPAAMDQLEKLGQQLSLPVFVRKGETDVFRIAREALEFAPTLTRDTIIFDTGGRLQIDEPLVQELVRLRDLIKPDEILLVLDAATGQEAVNVATHFDRALGISGSILTRLDGDARGGAALSLKAVTNKPIKFVGVGEKLEEFEPFHPERMASRILGMGDVVSLVERAAEAVDMDDARRMEEKMRKGQFDLNDMREQLQQMANMGGISGLMGMMPGIAKMKNQIANAGIDDKIIKRQVAVIDSMTRQERKSPDILKASRKKRIASGAGVKVEEVNKLLKMHRNMADMMKAMGSGKRGPMAGIAQAMGFGGGMKPPSPEEMKAMAEKMQGGAGSGGLPSLPKDLPVGLRQGLPNLPGLTGLSGKPTLPGLGGFPGKKK